MPADFIFLLQASVCVSFDKRSSGDQYHDDGNANCEVAGTIKHPTRCLQIFYLAQIKGICKSDNT